MLLRVRLSYYCRLVAGCCLQRNRCPQTQSYRQDLNSATAFAGLEGLQGILGAIRALGGLKLALRALRSFMSQNRVRMVGLGQRREFFVFEP